MPRTIRYRIRNGNEEYTWVDIREVAAYVEYCQRAVTIEAEVVRCSCGSENIHVTDCGGNHPSCNNCFDKELSAGPCRARQGKEQ
jgi:hypothetical protein